MTYRVLLGVTVLPFVVSGWLWSVWLSEQVNAAEPDPVTTVHAAID